MATLALNPEWNSLWMGLLVIRRMVPAIELAPNSVPCGPGNTSTRAMSAAYRSRLRPPELTGCSSRYSATLGTGAPISIEVWSDESVAMPRMKIDDWPGPRPAELTPGR